MKCAIVGCGYVADFYMLSWSNHPELEIAGVFDRDLQRAKNLAKAYNVPFFHNFNEILENSNIDIVINLTNIYSHYEVSKAALLADKHVYSEKPIANSLEEADELVGLAKERNLKFFVAPCNAYSPAMQIVRKILINREIGNVILIYAELDDGPTHMMDYTNWKSSTGCPWPYKEEFSLGCVKEHAGYHLSCLVALFGSICEVVSSSSSLINERGGTDFSISRLKFLTGVEARLTYSVIAPVNRSITFIGKQGVLRLQDCWNYNSPVLIQKYKRKHVGSGKFHLLLSPEKIIPLDLPFKKCYEDTHNMDFCLGVSYLIKSIKNRAFSSCLSAEYSYHILEIINAIEKSGYSRIHSCSQLEKTCLI